MRSIEGGAGLAELHERPVVGSFVDAILAIAIISPEGRMASATMAKRGQPPWCPVGQPRRFALPTDGSKEVIW